MKLNIPCAANALVTRNIIIAVVIVLFFSTCNYSVAATSAGTLIENSATLQYDGGFLNSNTVRLTVASVAGVDVSPTEAIVSVQRGETAIINLTVTNTGNSQDTFSLSSVSDQSWSTIIIADTNQDGILQATETTQLSSTGTIASGVAFSVFVKISVPGDLDAETSAQINLEVVSQLDSIVKAQASYTTIGKVPAPGDIDEDGQITSTDIDYAAQMAIGYGTWTPEQIGLADVNGDGIVDIKDVILILDISGALPEVSASGNGITIQLPESDVAADTVELIPIEISGGASVVGFQASFQFNDSLLTVNDVFAGQLIEEDSGWEVVYVVSEQEIRLLAYNSNGNTLLPGSGSILELAAEVSPVAASGDYSELTWLNATICDSSGNAITPLETIDGSIVVVDHGELLIQVSKEPNYDSIENAIIEVWQGETFVIEGITDSTGSCLLTHLAAGIYDVRVYADGYYVETFSQIEIHPAELNQVGFDLIEVKKASANTGAIEGIIFDDNGQPLDHVAVRIYYNGKRKYTGRTDSMGYYCAIGLEAGQYVVRVIISGHETDAQTVAVDAGQMTYGDFLLSPLGL